MANYTTTITNEGAALLASVIANQGTLTFNEFRFSENDYTGQESTLTEVTFLGVFITAGAAASVIDSTTIKASAQFNNSTITGNHDLYSIGIIGTDGNTTALIAVCTTTDPDVIREPLTGTSTYAFNVNLSVSDTSQINVFGTTAAILYDIDVVDTLISTATNKPLSANQGRLIGDNLAANENVYGAKNLNSLPYYESAKSENGITITSDDKGIVTASGTASAVVALYMHSDTIPTNKLVLPKGDYTLLGCPVGGSQDTYCLRVNFGGTQYYDVGSGVNFTLAADTQIEIAVIIKSGTALPVGGITIKPMICDARVIDPTFAPFAETNLQLTRKTSGLSNENLIDNPFFTVNQRGFVSVATNANRYIIDRWIVSNYTDANGICSLSSSGLTFDNSASAGETELMQKYEHSLDTTKQYTASIKLSNGTIYTASGSLPITVTIPSIGTVNATDTRFKIVISGGASAVTIRAVKLELGSVSTLANDVEPNYTTELLKCQRYFLCVEGLTNGAILGIGTPNSTTTMYAAVPLPTSMRATPTLSYTGTGHILQGGSTMALTNITIDTISNVYAQIMVVSSGLTIGQVGMLRASSGGLKIFLSADL